MNCPKCGTANPEDAVFCSDCGERVDGKKHCMKCGRLIDEKNLYCNYCGTRQDGKTVCKKCGNAFEGSFCPFCGEKEAEIAATAVAAAPRAAAKGSADKALSVVQTSLVFTGIVLLFVFSFFIGITGSVVSSDATLKSTDSTFYFLIGTWKDVSAVLEELRLANNGNLFFEASFSIYAPTVLMAVAVGANLVVCIVYGVLATCSFSKNIGRKEVSLFKYLLPPVITTLLAIVTVRTFCSLGDSVSSVENIRIGLSGATISELVLVSALIAAALVLEFVRNGRKYVGNIFKLVCLPLAAVLFIAAMATVSKNLLVAEELKMSFILSMCAILLPIGMSTSTLSDADVTLSALFVSEFFVFALCLVAVFLTIYFAVRAFKKDKPNNSCALGFGIASAVLFAAFLAIAALIAKYMGESKIIGAKAAIGSSPIVGLVLCAAALAAVVVYIATLKKAENKPLSQDISAEIN